MIAQRLLRFATPHEKAAYLQREALRDSRLPLVLATARRFAAIRDPRRRALAIHTFVRDAVVYVKDLGGEEFADSDVVLLRGFDDCDGKARLVVALVLAAEALLPCGLSARLVPVFPEPNVFSHVAAELSWPGCDSFEGARGGWVRCETILEDCPLGRGFEAAKRDDAGRILYA